MKSTVMMDKLLTPLGRGEKWRKAGMTLIEIILVIALIGTIMTIVITNLTGQQEQAMVDAARISMQNLSNPLNMYKVHNFKYPDNLDALLTNPGDSKRWRGPYTEEKKLMDPWGTPYSYELDGKKFRIISAGPDGELGTADDIIYPDEEPELDEAS